MKLNHLCVAALTSSAAVANGGIVVKQGVAISDSAPAPQNVAIYNLMQETHEVWINGDYHALDGHSGLISFCLPREKVEVQISDQMHVTECGTTLVVNGA